MPPPKQTTYGDHFMLYQHSQSHRVFVLPAMTLHWGCSTFDVRVSAPPPPSIPSFYPALLIYNVMRHDNDKGTTSRIFQIFIYNLESTAAMDLSLSMRLFLTSGVGGASACFHCILKLSFYASVALKQRQLEKCPFSVIWSYILSHTANTFR